MTALFWTGVMRIELVGDNPPFVFADGFFGDLCSCLARQKPANRPQLEIPEINEE